MTPVDFQEGFLNPSRFAGEVNLTRFPGVIEYRHTVLFYIIFLNYLLNRHGLNSDL